MYFKSGIDILNQYIRMPTALNIVPMHGPPNLNVKEQSWNIMGWPLLKKLNMPLQCNAVIINHFVCEYIDCSLYKSS